MCVLKERKWEGQTEEQSVSLRGLVCLVGASLGCCPGASVAWRRGARLCSDRWRWALSESLPVSRIDCRGPSQPLCSLLNLPHERGACDALDFSDSISFLFIFFFWWLFQVEGGGVKQCVLVQRWAVSGSLALMPVGSSTAIVLIVLSFSSTLFIVLYCAVYSYSAVAGKKYPTRDQMYLCCRVLDECKQAAERSREWVTHGLILKCISRVFSGDAIHYPPPH